MIVNEITQITLKLTEEEETILSKCYGILSDICSTMYSKDCENIYCVDCGNLTFYSMEELNNARQFIDALLNSSIDLG